MKLTKDKLNRLVRKGIEELGYTYFKDRTSCAQGLYAKYLGDGFYLTIGLVIHRFYYDAFDADMFFSNTTNIYAGGMDFPMKVSERPGFLLTEEERSIYYIEGSLNSSKGALDIWWHSDAEGPNNIENFLQTLKVAESRFLEKKEVMIDLIRKSTQADKFLNEMETIIEIFKKNDFKGEYNLIPLKEIDNIPMNWFKAAEDSLELLGKEPSAGWVKYLVPKAYRMYELRDSYKQKSERD